MRFAQPWVLVLLAALPALGILLASSQGRRRRRLARFTSLELLPRLALGDSTARWVLGSLLRLAAIGLAIVALARPQWGRRDEPVVRRGVDVVFALDLSASMLAEDVSPSRLEQARAAAGSLLGTIEGDRVGLVVFGGRPATQCPLTLDYGAVRLFLDAAEADFAPGPGTDLGRAVEEASRLFKASERRYKTIVLFTDGEDLEGRGAEASRRAREEGIVIHAIGHRHGGRRSDSASRRPGHPHRLQERPAGEGGRRRATTRRASRRSPWRRMGSCCMRGRSEKRDGGLPRRSGAWKRGKSPRGSRPATKTATRSPWHCVSSAGDRRPSDRPPRQGSRAGRGRGGVGYALGARTRRASARAGRNGLRTSGGSASRRRGRKGLGGARRRQASSGSG